LQRERKVPELRTEKGGVRIDRVTPWKRSDAAEEN
jgi:hypothetical protein